MDAKNKSKRVKKNVVLLNKNLCVRKGYLGKVLAFTEQEKNTNAINVKLNVKET